MNVVRLIPGAGEDVMEGLGTLSATFNSSITWCPGLLSSSGRAADCAVRIVKQHAAGATFQTWQCLNVSTVAGEVSIAGDELTLSPSLALDEFDCTFAVVIDSGTVCAAVSNSSFDGFVNGTSWVFRTEPEPFVPPDAVTSNTTTDVTEVEVYGVGLWLTDVSQIDLLSGTFFTDFHMYLLRYYRTFPSVELAVADATDDSPFGRRCLESSGETPWLFLQNATQSIESFVHFLNIDKLPKITTIMRGEGDELDHFRVQSNFFFAPDLIEYPFATQQLPVSIELASDTTQSRPSKVMCMLDRFTGFPELLSSFSANSSKPGSRGHSELTAQFHIDEANHWPPLQRDSDGEAWMTYPPTGPGRGLAPSRQASRARFVMQWTRATSFGLLELAPAFFIAVGAVTNYALPAIEFRSRLSTCTTALLAAIIQHTGVRSRLPPQAVLTRADCVMVIVYITIVLGLLSTGCVAVFQTDRRLRPWADDVHNYSRLLGVAGCLLWTLPLFTHPWEAEAVGTVVALSLSTWMLLSGIWFYHNHPSGGGSENDCERILSRFRKTMVRPRLAHWFDWSADEVHDWLYTLPAAHPEEKEIQRRRRRRQRQKRQWASLPPVVARRAALLVREENISGMSLPELTVSGLRELGLPFGDAVLLHRLIASLRMRWPNEEDDEKERGGVGDLDEAAGSGIELLVMGSQDGRRTTDSCLLGGDGDDDEEEEDDDGEDGDESKENEDDTTPFL